MSSVGDKTARGRSVCPPGVREVLMGVVLCGVAGVASGAASGVAPGATSGPTLKSRGAGERGVTVSETEFRGHKAIVLRNRVAEIVVVPATGRVMRFDLLGDKGAPAQGPFWNHPKFGNQTQGRRQPAAAAAAAADADGWTNHGGDKAWPAPQSDWPKVTGHGWPPPKGFDAMPFTVPSTHPGGRVHMVSALDPDYGIRVRRTVALDPRAPVMTIDTSYEKVRGTPVRVGVWTITQLESPDRLFILLPPRRGHAFPNGYLSLLPDAPGDLGIDGRLLSMTRDHRRKTMISSDGRSLLWVGQGPDLLVEDTTPEATGPAGARPNRGARSQIYTSPGRDKDNENDAGTKDVQKYVELELLGRPQDLGPGSKTAMRARYTLIRRTEADPREEAKKVFARR